MPPGTKTHLLRLGAKLDIYLFALSAGSYDEQSGAAPSINKTLAVALAPIESAPVLDLSPSNLAFLWTPRLVERHVCQHLCFTAVTGHWTPRPHWSVTLKLSP